MDAPAIHVHRLELGGDAGIEDTLLHVCGNPRAIVQDGDDPSIALPRRGDEDAPGAGVAGVAQHLDDGILDALDVVLGLAPLRFRHAEADKALAQVLLDPERALAPHGSDEVGEV